MNELIKNVDHIHNILTKILTKYHTGRQLTDSEEEIIGELYIAKEENRIQKIDSTLYKPNINLNYFIMSGVPGMKRKKKDHLLTKGGESIPISELDQQILSLEGETFPESDSSYLQILGIIQKGGNINDVYAFCQEKLQEKPLTLRTAYRHAIINRKSEKGKEKDAYEDFKLLKKIHENIPLVVKELAEIEEAVKQTYVHPEIVGFIIDHIENK